MVSMSYPGLKCGGVTMIVGSRDFSSEDEKPVTPRDGGDGGGGDVGGEARSITGGSQAVAEASDIGANQSERELRRAAGVMKDEGAWGTPVQGVANSKEGRDEEKTSVDDGAGGRGREGDEADPASGKSVLFVRALRQAAGLVAGGAVGGPGRK